MERRRVVSSNLVSVGYDDQNSTLEIEFGSGVYDYFGVPNDVYSGLMRADSHGKYFHRNIRDKYPYNKVR